ncbi:hypothetical protein LINPERPRIM_LOCUS19440 [Linum perenne]
MPIADPPHELISAIGDGVIGALMDGAVSPVVRDLF